MRFTHGTWTGTVYVAFALDLFSRRIIGWRAGLLDKHVCGLRQSSSGCPMCWAQGTALDWLWCPASHGWGIRKSRRLTAPSTTFAPASTTCLPCRTASSRLTASSVALPVDRCVPRDPVVVVRFGIMDGASTAVARWRRPSLRRRIDNECEIMGNPLRVIRRRSP
jgi:transposase InsO family protein